MVLSPAAGAALMALSTVIVAINARFLHVEREDGVEQTEPPDTRAGSEPEEERRGMKTDPVCRMQVPEDEACTAEYEGETYYFCSQGCRDKFLHAHPRQEPRTAYDLLIIGGGPAGMTAAVYADTLNIDAFVVTGDLGGQAIDSTKIKNYMGFDFITGPELVEKFKDQLLHSHYVDHRIAEVEKLEPAEDGYRATLADMSTCTAGAVILATGMRRRKLGVPGEEEFQRKGVFYPNVQDVSFVQGKDVLVVGGGNSGMQLVETLLPVARQIHVVSDLPLTADSSLVERVAASRRVHRYEGYKVRRIEGDDTVQSVVIHKLAEPEEATLNARGVFIAIGLHPNATLAAGLADLNDRGEIVIGPDCSTGRPGLFAAGDATSAYGKRIIIASGEGAKAALAAKQFLLHR
ncbi:MAG: FAD-dependent oxidoreductase [Phycisphaerae bacterium]